MDFVVVVRVKRGRMTADRHQREHPIGVVEKVAVLLRHLADGGPEGSRLKDLAESTRFPRASVHRLLTDLLDQRLVDQTADRRYVLGQQLFELSLAAPNPMGNLERFHSTVRDLAVELGDVVYLSMRRGGTMQYLMREAGAYPIRTYTVQVGELRRITTSYSGLAMLATMAPDAAQRVIRSTERQPEEAMRLIRLLGRLRQEVRTLGYVAGSDLVLDGYTGISGVAVTVPHEGALPFLSLSASAVSQRLPASRYPEVADALQRAAGLVAELVADSP